MKLKKKHFKKLKEIAVAVNQILPGTGIRLDKLIAEIESVQKVKNQCNYFNNLSKAIENREPTKITKSSGKPLNGITEIEKGSEIEKLLNDALVLSNTDPKIGDIGYFWRKEPICIAIYSELQDFGPGFYQDKLGTIYENFSKTPPEFK